MADLVSDIDSAEPSALLLRVGSSRKPQLRAGISTNQYVQILPDSESYAGTLTAGNRVNFRLQTSNELIDLKNSFFAIQYTVAVTPNGGAAGSVTNIQPVRLANGAACRIFSQMDVRINDVSVTDDAYSQPNMGHWAEYIQKITESGPTTGRGGLAPFAAGISNQSVGLAMSTVSGGTTGDITNFVTGYSGTPLSFSDQVGGWFFAGGTDALGTECACGENEVFPQCDVAAARANAAISQRSAAYGVMIAQPQCTVWQSTQMLPPGTSFNITFTLADPAAIIQQQLLTSNVAAGSINADAVVTIQNIRFWPKLVTLADRALTKVRQALLVAPFWYNFLNHKVFIDGVSNGATAYRRSGILPGGIPNRVFVMFSRNATGVTSRLISPYCTSSKGYVRSQNGAANESLKGTAIGLPVVSRLQLKIGGSFFPQEAITTQVAASTVADMFRAYVSYLEACGCDLRDSERQPPLSYNQFCKDYLVYCISVRPDGVADPETSVPQDAISASAATVGIEVVAQFLTAPSADCNIVVVTQTPAALTINHTGGVRKIGF